MPTQTEVAPTRAEKKAAVRKAIASLKAANKPLSAEATLLITGGRRNVIQELYREVMEESGVSPARVSPAQQQAADAVRVQRDLQRQLEELTQKEATWSLVDTRR